MTLRIVVLIGMLTFWIPLPSATSSALAGYQGASASISLGSDQQSAAPGEIVSFSVGVSYFDPQGGIQAAFSGGVLVLIPSGLTLVGQPSCTAGCEFPSVGVVGQESRIEVQVDLRGDERASMSFQVMVSPSAAVGSSYTLTAYLLGGVNTAGGSETAFATLTVTGPAAGSESAANRDVYLNVTPRLLRVAPGGSALYLIHWSADPPEYTVEVRLPSGVTLATEPSCGPVQSTVPTVSTCDIEEEERSDGTSMITANPGFTSGESNSLYVTLAFDPTLVIGTELRLHTSLRILSGVQDSAYQHAVVTDPSEIASSGEDSAVSARLEMASNFTRQGDTCSIDDPNYEYEFVLNELGLTAEVARIDVPAGRIGSASTGTGNESDGLVSAVVNPQTSPAEVCIIDVRFEDVSGSSLYILAQVSAGGTIMCRACVLGLMTTGQQAEQVFVLD